MSELLEFLSKGGILMIPIGASSIIGLALFLERLWSLQRTKILPARFLEIVSRLLQERRYAEAEALCMQHNNPMASILGAGIRYAGRDRELIKEVMEETGRREIFFMERFSNVLGSISTITPLMGLLGTVVGLIQMFRRLVGGGEAAAQSMVDVSLLAGGIWQALITTAAGLSVAIPIFLAYRYVLSRVDRYAVEIEDVSLKAIELLVQSSQRPNANINDEPSLEGDEADSKVALVSEVSSKQRERKAAQEVAVDVAEDEEPSP